MVGQCLAIFEALGFADINIVPTPWMQTGKRFVSPRTLGSTNRTAVGIFLSSLAVKPPGQGYYVPRVSSVTLSRVVVDHCVCGDQCLH